VQDAFHRGRVEVLTVAWTELDQSDRDALTCAIPALRRLAALLHAGAVRPTDQRQGGGS